MAEFRKADALGSGLSMSRRAVVLGAMAAALPRGARAEQWSPAPYSAPAPPAITGAAAFVYDATSGTPLFALNADEPRPPASLAKIATALVVLEHGNLDDEVTIEEGDLVDETQSRVGLVPGDVLTVRDLLYGLMIPSGSDAAKAVGRHVGASLDPVESGDPYDAFIAEMNRYVERLGMTATRFANATGLDQEGSSATARDLATLTAIGMQDPLFREIVATSRITLPSRVKAEGYEIFTTNDLLVEGTAIGVKTGTTGDAGGCLVIATVQGENLILSVVMGSELEWDELGNPKSPSRYVDMRTMLAAVDDEYEWVDPALAAGLPEELAAWDAQLSGGPLVPVPRGRADALAHRLELGAPADPGTEVGRVLFLFGGEMIAERPVLQAG